MTNHVFQRPVSKGEKLFIRRILRELLSLNPSVIPKLQHRRYADRNSRRGNLLLAVISIAKCDRLDSGEPFSGIELHILGNSRLSVLLTFKLRKSFIENKIRTKTSSSSWR